MPESAPQTIDRSADTYSDRKSFLKLSIEERNRILEQQATAALPYYQQNQAEWQEWLEQVSFDSRLSR